MRSGYLSTPFVRLGGLTLVEMTEGGALGWDERERL
jgi:hypothetical protein